MWFLFVVALGVQDVQVTRYDFDSVDACIAAFEDLNEIALETEMIEVTQCRRNEPRHD